MTVVNGFRSGSKSGRLSERRRDYAAVARSAIGIGLRFKPELVVLSPLSLALLSLMREARLSRRVSPRSESTERFAPWPLLTAFLR